MAGRTRVRITRQHTFFDRARRYKGLTQAGSRGGGPNSASRGLKQLRFWRGRRLNSAKLFT